jgi:hypothetical protein
MAYTYSPFPVWVVKHPIISALVVTVLGVGGGLLAALVFPERNLFERFGSVTTMLGLLVFGTLGGELLVRSQGTFAMQNDGEPGGPFKFAPTRKALTLQTVVVCIGTIQWGFGSLMFAR